MNDHLSSTLEIDHRELVAKGSDDLRQAGTLGEFDSDFKKDVKLLCESDLFEFTYFILKREYLTVGLHAPVCAWLTKSPPYRKLLLLPRRHAKTSIVAHGLPIHILIQPKENNVYIPGKQGCDTRILLAGETATRAQDNLSVIRDVFEKNELFRRMWPHCVWEGKKKRQRWNQEEILIPRNENYPDPSVRTIGVDGAITGARHDVHIKDDLVSEEASNSEVVMNAAIRWHKNTRALMDDQDKGLEFVIGTRWAVQDLYSDMIKNDPTVAVMKRSIVEDGKPIYPEVFSMTTVEKLRQEHGAMFALMYMNNVGDPELVDFLEDDLRKFTLHHDHVEYEEDGRDVALHKKATEVITSTHAEFVSTRGQSWSSWLEEYDRDPAREAYFRFRR